MKISVADIAFVETLAQNSNVDLRGLLSELGLPRDLFSSKSHHEVELIDYMRVLRYLTEITGDETCSASDRLLKAGTSDYLLKTMPSGISLIEGMQHLAAGYNVVHGGEFNRVIQTRNRTGYCVDDKGFPYASEALANDSHSFMESIIVSLHFLFCELVDEALETRIIRVQTPRPEADEMPSFLRFWKCPIVFGSQFHAIEYDGRVGDLRVKRSSEQRLASVFEVALQNEVIARFGAASSNSWAKEIGTLILSGMHTQSTVARNLGMSVATMRRRLKQENTTFRDIRARVLNERAHHLINRGAQIATVAHELGFADLRSFSRAFLAWNKITPTAYRERHSARAEQDSEI